MTPTRGWGPGPHYLRDLVASASDAPAPAPTAPTAPTTPAPSGAQEKQ